MYKGEIRRVLKRIKNKQKHSANITRFLLDTGDKVFASELEEVKHE